MDFKLKIGLIPERRDVANAKTRTGAFRASSAIENKEKILKYIKDNFADEKTEFVDLEWLNDEGLLFDANDVDKVKDEFIRQGVDASTVTLVTRKLQVRLPTSFNCLRFCGDLRIWNSPRTEPVTPMRSVVCLQSAISSDDSVFLSHT